MLPDRVSNPGPLTYESVALPIALRGPAMYGVYLLKKIQLDWATKITTPSNLSILSSFYLIIIHKKDMNYTI